MRIVVFSDSHRNFAALHGVFRSQKDADVFLHLGDGEEEFEDLKSLYPDKLMRGVAGNCDWGSQGKIHDLIVCGGKRIFFTHGHVYGVKSGTDRLLDAARDFGAEIVLFGHTHRAGATYENGLYVMNPGSVSQSRGGPASYGVVDITPAGIVPLIIPLERRRRR